MQITPGYNFEPNEVPTRAKLTLMVSGMQVRGIDIGQIATDLVGVKLTGDTQCSLPAEGWLMRSPQGTMWVQSRHGRVPWWRGNWGGMEGKRFSAISAAVGLVGSSARPCTLWSAHPTGSAPSTSESCTAFAYAAPSGNNHRSRFRVLDSAASCVITRFLLFGGNVFPEALSMGVAGNVRFQLYEEIGGTANDSMQGRTVPYSSSGLADLTSGVGLKLDTCVTTAYVRDLGWHYGPAMYIK